MLKKGKAYATRLRARRRRAHLVAKIKRLEHVETKLIARKRRAFLVAKINHLEDLERQLKQRFAQAKATRTQRRSQRRRPHPQRTAIEPCELFRSNSICALCSDGRCGKIVDCDAHSLTWDRRAASATIQRAWRTFVAGRWQQRRQRLAMKHEAQMHHLGATAIQCWWRARLYGAAIRTIARQQARQHAAEEEDARLYDYSAPSPDAWQPLHEQHQEFRHRLQLLRMREARAFLLSRAQRALAVESAQHDARLFLERRLAQAQRYRVKKLSVFTWLRPGYSCNCRGSSHLHIDGWNSAYHVSAVYYHMQFYRLLKSYRLLRCAGPAVHTCRISY